MVQLARGRCTATCVSRPCPSEHGQSGVVGTLDTTRAADSACGTPETPKESPVVRVLSRQGGESECSGHTLPDTGGQTQSAEGARDHTSRPGSESATTRSASSAKRTSTADQTHTTTGHTLQRAHTPTVSRAPVTHAQHTARPSRREAFSCPLVLPSSDLIDIILSDGGDVPVCASGRGPWRGSGFS